MFVPSTPKAASSKDILTRRPNIGPNSVGARHASPGVIHAAARNPDQRKRSASLHFRHFTGAQPLFGEFPCARTAFVPKHGACAVLFGIRHLVFPVSVPKARIEPCPQIGDHRQIGRIVDQVAHLIGVFAQIVEFFNIPDPMILDKFVVVGSQRECR